MNQHQSAEEMSWGHWENLDDGDIVYRRIQAAVFPDADVRQWARGNHTVFNIISVVAVMGDDNGWAAYVEMSAYTFMVDPQDTARSGVKLPEGTSAILFPLIAENPRWQWRR